mmetsp:Transcript_4055/g.4604  ORF Transcript_4055/g.4604 Transcript_4055/m.4604 type:complete len:344 (+) Transcript_4055:134-1165(+)
MVSLSCRRRAVVVGGGVPSSHSSSSLLSLAKLACVAVVLSSVLSDSGVIVVDAASASADVMETASSSDCDQGMDLPADFDGSAWPKMYRLNTPNPDDPMAANSYYKQDVLVDPSVLAKAGVTYRFLDPAGYDYPNKTAAIPWFPFSNGTNDEELQELRDEEDYQYADIVAVTSFIPSYWEEHFHEADTMRYILDGSGYFDLRDLNNEWVRMYVTAGDFLEWPAGIQHRFTIDNATDTGTGGYGDGTQPPFIQAMRLYKGSSSPDWESVYEAMPGNNTARDDYVATYLCDINPLDDAEEGGGNDDTMSNIPTPDTEASSSAARLLVSSSLFMVAVGTTMSITLF